MSSPGLPLECRLPRGTDLASLYAMAVGEVVMTPPLPYPPAMICSGKTTSLSQ